MAQQNYGNQDNTNNQPASPAQPARQNEQGAEKERSQVGKKPGQAWEKDQEEDLDSSAI